MSIIRITPAFARTKCRECARGFDLGEEAVSRPDGFRHLICKPERNP